jgi:hypothetical protein
MREQYLFEDRVLMTEAGHSSSNQEHRLLYTSTSVYQKGADMSMRAYIVSPGFIANDNTPKN